MAFSLQNYTDLGYTRDTLIKQLLLIQQHSSDDSAAVAHCMCVEDKHLILLEGLSEEGATIALSNKEKQFYTKLADLTRHLRKEIMNESFDMHGIMRKTMKVDHPTPLHKGNPIAWTICELEHPKIKKKIDRCVKAIEKHQTCDPKDWGTSKECVNPFAVCRATIKCP